MIDLASIYHRTGDNFCYLYKEDILHIRLRTKKDNVHAVTLIYGDQYKTSNYRWQNSLLEMQKTGSDQLHDYWQASVTDSLKRLRYGFIIKEGDEQITFTEKGFFPFLPEDPGYYFCLPYIHETELFTPPDWVRETIWYQIFPERFRNGDPDRNPIETAVWGQEAPGLTNYFGGDLQGIIDSLDYLQDLGITGIYLTPIFYANSNHKYNTIDYLQIDPHFGDVSILKQLVSECHMRGIRVMLDAVFNHCGYMFPPFQDVLNNGERSPYKDWFHVHQYPLKDSSGFHYETFGFYEDMPKFNTANKAVRDYLLHVAEYWIKECDIDGWRLDVANEVDHAFWREFRKRVKAVKPDCFILGEIWHDSMPWLRGEQFDSVMNYPLLSKSLQFFAYDMISAKGFVEDMTSIVHAYPDNVNKVLFNIIGSHDTPRVMQESHYRPERVKQLFTFLFTFPGTPCIYYGDEIGLDGGSDPGCRKCMEWDKEKQNVEIKEYLKKLISIRKSAAILSGNASFAFLPVLNNCIAYCHRNENEIFMTVMNNSPDQVSYPLPFSLKGKKLTMPLTCQEYAAESEHLNVNLGAYENILLHFYI
ncbi:MULTISPECIES: glycoside hydrolase family 13 protein [unclassified Niallia]|uniref:glycoside hydrolase family 13 protein n=1 Tax=unclassified Niallia TaxID=2837522 RepID=UPI001EDC00A8|nr:MULTISPECIES: glycoside hydrolase family 13 protein [unclassified Niallia]MDL0434625.1 glycoside hydrolase family 13 protein [Niallia sp. SS-2023]UPO88411.1 alpha-glycosidase [Niallia sp. Man26]